MGLVITVIDFQSIYIDLCNNRSIIWA